MLEPCSHFSSQFLNLTSEERKHVFLSGQRDIRKALRDALDNNVGELEQDEEKGYTEDKYLGRLVRRVSNRSMKPIDFR